MAKLFLVLAIVVSVAAAALGLLGKDKIDKLQGILKETRQTLARTESSLKRTEGELTKTKEDLTTANTKIETQTGEIATLKKEKEDTVLKLASAEMDRDKAKADLETANTKIAEMSKMPGAPAGETVDIVSLKADLDKAKNDLAEKSQMVETLTRNKAEFDEKLANANKEIDRYRAGVTRQGLTGKVLAVNPGWNFVVLSVGDRQGAATGGVMIVTRGGEAIGRLRITSIEPSTSIADIVPGSVRRGVTIQPGDAVVYEGPRNKPVGGSGDNLAAPLPPAAAVVQ